jgi:hypothetical protein
MSTVRAAQSQPGIRLCTSINVNGRRTIRSSPPHRRNTRLRSISPSFAYRPVTYTLSPAWELTDPYPDHRHPRIIADPVFQKHFTVYYY